MRKLEIGSGNNPQPGYEHLEINKDCPNVDYCCDCRSIPVPDNTFDEIAAFHVIEHMEWLQAEVAIREWHRVLKPGGILKIATPNLRYIIDAYMDQSDEIWKRELQIPGWSFPDECHTDKTAWLNFKLFSTDIPYNLHKASFDDRWLGKKLTDAGFIDITTSSEPTSLNMSGKKK